MTTPNIDSDPNRWPEPWRSLWAERAAIMEHDGKLPRKEAEERAAAIIRHDFNRAVAEREW